MAMGKHQLFHEQLHPQIPIQACQSFGSTVLPPPGWRNDVGGLKSSSMTSNDQRNISGSTAQNTRVQPRFAGTVQPAKLGATAESTVKKSSAWQPVSKVTSVK